MAMTAAEIRAWLADATAVLATMAADDPRRAKAEAMLERRRAELAALEPDTRFCGCGRALTAWEPSPHGACAVCTNTQREAAGLPPLVADQDAQGRWHWRAVTEPGPGQRFPFSVRWAREKGVLEVRDPWDGSWLQIDANEAPDYWRREATDKARAARVRRAA